MAILTSDLLATYSSSSYTLPNISFVGSDIEVDVTFECTNGSSIPDNELTFTLQRSVVGSGIWIDIANVDSVVYTISSEFNNGIHIDYDYRFLVVEIADQDNFGYSNILSPRITNYVDNLGGYLNVSKSRCSVGDTIIISWQATNSVSDSNTLSSMITTTDGDLYVSNSGSAEFEVSTVGYQDILLTMSVSNGCSKVLSYTVLVDDGTFEAEILKDYIIVVVAPEVIRYTDKKQISLVSFNTQAFVNREFNYMVQAFEYYLNNLYKDA